MGLFSKKHSIGKTIAELRKSRNNTVHSVKKAEKLTIDEVKQCIDLIVKLN